jgi:hypothetical protein
MSKEKPSSPPFELNYEIADLIFDLASYSSLLLEDYQTRKVTEEKRLDKFFKVVRDSDGKIIEFTPRSILDSPDPINTTVADLINPIVHDESE